MKATRIMMIILLNMCLLFGDIPIDFPPATKSSLSLDKKTTTSYVAFDTSIAESSNITGARVQLPIKKVQSDGRIATYVLFSDIIVSVNVGELVTIVPVEKDDEVLSIDIPVNDLKKYLMVYVEGIDGVSLDFYEDSKGKNSFVTMEPKLTLYYPENQKGDKGDKGDTGLQGPIGLTGLQGEQGPVGPQGLNGKDGMQGLNGEDGEVGPQGDKGEVGPQGDKGDKGDKGDTGPQGIAGVDGEVGPKGEQGIQGQQGPKGDKGDTGPQGIQGPMGPSGTIVGGGGDSIAFIDYLGFSTVTSTTFSKVQGRTLTFVKAQPNTRIMIVYDDLMGVSLNNSTLVTVAWRILLNNEPKGGEKALVKSASAGVHLEPRVLVWILSGIDAGTYTLTIEARVSGAHMVAHGYPEIEIENFIEVIEK